MVEKIKEFHPEIKVIYMSGYTENMIVKQGIIMEGINFIQKPFSMKKLAQKVRTVLDTA